MEPIDSNLNPKLVLPSSTFVPVNRPLYSENSALELDAYSPYHPKFESDQDGDDVVASNDLTGPPDNLEPKRKANPIGPALGDGEPKRVAYLVELKSPITSGDIGGNSTPPRM